MTSAATPGNGNNTKAYRPMLFVGLGGSGKEVLLRLRLRLQERFRTFDVPFARFLWADTDTRATDARGEALSGALASVGFDEHEKFALLKGSVGKDLADIFTNPNQWPHIHEWLYPEVQRLGGEIADGAGGVRAVGRLTFFAKYGPLRELLSRKLAELARMETIAETQRFFRSHGLPAVSTEAGASPAVCVVTSLAGGTGCGTFLDVGFLLRDLKASTHSGSDAFAYALLPNVYYEGPRGELPQRSYANAYAALMELDHYTKRINAANSLDAKEGNQYSDFLVSWERNRPRRVVGPPFSATYLLELTNEAHLPISQENRSDLFSMLAETLLLDLLPGPFSDAKRSDYSNIAQALSSAANATTGAETRIQQVFGRRYASCGMSKIGIPLDTVRGAAAAQLAAHIFDYIRRERDDARHGEAVPRDLAANRLDQTGLVNEFGPEWRGMIVSAVASAAAEPVRTGEDVSALRERLDRAEFNTVLADTDRLGTATRWLRSRTATVTAEAKTRFEHLLSDRVLENPERGLATALRKGYFDLLVQRTRELVDPSREGEAGLYEAEAKLVEEEARQFRAQRDHHLNELTAATGSLAARVLAVRPALLQLLHKRVVDAQEQYLFAVLTGLMLGEARKVAQELLRTMIATRDALGSFLEKADAVRGEAEARFATYRARLEHSPHVLFQQIFDWDRDWPRFYRLDLHPDNNQPAEVQPRKEYDRLLRELNMGNLLGLAETLRRQTAAELSREVFSYCDRRFAEDMQAHPREVRVLDHPSFRDPGKAREAIGNFVNAARPMLRRDRKLAATDVESTTFAYLGIADKDSPASREFAETVSQLAGQKIEVFDTGRPHEVYLYFSTFAFPLPSVSLVQSDCHHAYVDFYGQLQPGQMQRAAQGIPLHLSKRWEGRFDDLVSYSDQEAELLEQALGILNFAPALAILQAQVEPVTQMPVYSYRDAPPFHTSTRLGMRRNALALLLAGTDLREALREVVAAREASLTPPQLAAYFWALQSALLAPDLEPDSPDYQLLRRKFAEVYARVGRVAPDLLPQLDTSALPPEGALEWIKAHDMGLDWTDGAPPVVRGLELWRRPVVHA